MTEASRLGCVTPHVGGENRGPRTPSPVGHSSHEPVPTACPGPCATGGPHAPAAGTVDLALPSGKVWPHPDRHAGAGRRAHPFGPGLVSFSTDVAVVQQAELVIPIGAHDPRTRGQGRRQAPRLVLLLDHSNHLCGPGPHLGRSVAPPGSKSHPAPALLHGVAGDAVQRTQLGRTLHESWISCGSDGLTPWPSGRTVVSGGQSSCSCRIAKAL